MLLKAEIINEYKAGRIIIEPFNIKNVGPNSYDVTLGNTLKVYTCEVLDVKRENQTQTIQIPKQGIILEPFKLYLGSTVEKAGSDYYIPCYDGKSSQARNGIMSHISAGFGDIGFKSNWTLEIVVIHPIRVYAGMKIGQIYFTDVNQKFNIPANRYNGKYVDQPLPQASKSYLDFIDDDTVKTIEMNPGIKNPHKLHWGC